MFCTLMVTPENTIEAVRERYEAEKREMGWLALCRDSDVFRIPPFPVQSNPHRLKHGYGYSEGEREP